ncbi:hypothetical protein AB0C29_43880, partial [Actinoplanes sp. NPDC048791]
PRPGGDGTPAADPGRHRVADLRAGLVATVTSGGASLAIGGILGVVATGLIALTTPALRRFTVEDRVTEPVP